MTNDQDRDQGKQRSSQQDRQIPGQQNPQQQRQGSQQEGKDKDNQYRRPGESGQRNSQEKSWE